MFSKKGNLSLIKHLLEKEPFIYMSEEELFDNIELIRQKLNNLKAEYAFRVHMENGLESYEDNIIDDIKKLEKLLYMISLELNVKKDYQRNIKKEIKVKDLNENEEYLERYNLNIPQKTILIDDEVHGKQKTR